MSDIFEQVERDLNKDFDKTAKRVRRGFNIVAITIIIGLLIFWGTVITLIVCAVLAGPEKIGEVLGSIWASFSGGFAAGKGH